jgi:hypothetical protein
MLSALFTIKYNTNMQAGRKYIIDSSEEKYSQDRDEDEYFIKGYVYM